jgi:hypothetical protein
LLSQEGLYLMSIDRHTIVSGADRESFPEAHQYTPDLGKARIDPEMIEQLCELITELAKGQY